MRASIGLHRTRILDREGYATRAREAERKGGLTAWPAGVWPDERWSRATLAPLAAAVRRSERRG